jgi:RimK family alpha-L-glutamate ligase
MNSKNKTREITIGYVFCDRKLGGDEKAFLNLARKKKLNFIMFNISKEINERAIEAKAAKCDIIFNNSAEEYATEFVKTLEELGKKVIDSSRCFYYSEDKWMFFLKCKRAHVPTPKTNLLSSNIREAMKDVHAFNQWPIIIKKIDGCQGDFVKKADNPQQAEKIIKKFWPDKGRDPIIIQEFIKSKSYRVTAIGNKIVQTATKDATGWKSTGVYQKIHHKFKVDKKLKRIVNQVLRVSRINVCGIDFLKKDGKWLVIEVNAVPSFDFFLSEREKLIGKVLDLLVKKVKSSSEYKRKIARLEN